MPNWCYNYAKCTFPSEELYLKFLSSIDEKNLFMTFAPLCLGKDISMNDIYDYHTACIKWKTKWEPIDVNIMLQDNDTFEIEFSFDTAWSPPTGVYEIMAREHKIYTTSNYYENGQQYFGMCCYDENVETNISYDYPTSIEELEQIKNEIGLGSELDDFMSPIWEQLIEDWLENESDEEKDEEKK